VCGDDRDADWVGVPAVTLKLRRNLAPNVWLGGAELACRRSVPLEAFVGPQTT
jgi:hypothetical protein